MKLIILLAVILMVLVSGCAQQIDRGLDSKSSKAAQLAAMDAQCAKYSFEDCSRTVTAGNSSGNCSWSEEKDRCAVEKTS